MTAVAPLAAAALMLPAAALAQGDPVSISYETGECFGFCPVYRVTVNADGTGLFEGRRHTAVEGRRAFRITRAQFRSFARHLAPFRPARGRISYDYDTRCQGRGMPHTDAPSVDVTWRGPGVRRQVLHFYVGCPNRPIGSVLAAAPGALPVAGFIGPRCRQNCSR